MPAPGCSGRPRRGLLGLVPAALALALAACAGMQDDFDLPEPEEPPLRPVPFVDIQRYMGRWYMIANIPYFAEAGNVAVTVEYAPRDDGLFDDTYTARDSFDEPPFVKQGLVEFDSPLTHNTGRVTFLRPIWQEFAVVFLDEDYRHTVIAHPSRDYAWVFSREPRMDDAVYQAAMAALSANGFDVRRVLRIPQHRNEVGLPGYQ